MPTPRQRVGRRDSRRRARVRACRQRRHRSCPSPTPSRCRRRTAQRSGRRRRRGPGRCHRCGASLRAEGAGIDLYRVERRGVERAEGRLRPVAEAGVAPPAVVRAPTAAEVGIRPSRGRSFHRSTVASRRRSGTSICRGELGDRRRLDDPSGVGRRAGLEAGEAVPRQVVPVEDHPGGMIDVLEARSRRSRGTPRPVRCSSPPRW